MTAAAGPRRSVELACEVAGKNHAFCPRGFTALAWLAESAAGDFQPTDKELRHEPLIRTSLD